MNNAPRKFISIFLVVLMLASMLPTTVFAATAPTVTAASVEKEMIAGQTVDVDITLSDNPGITGGTVKIKFEKAKLKLTSVKNTNQTITSTYDGYSVMPITSGSYTLSWDGGLLSADLTGNGVIATLTFEVLDTATVGDSTITVSDVDFTNFNLDVLTGTGVNGKVTLYSKLTSNLPIDITVPVKGNTPQSAIAATTQYTGTIAWEGNPTTFAADTKYTAKVELTANTGYQFANGVNPTVAGSDSVTDVNVKDSGSKLEFKATFPKTADKDPLKGTVSLNSTAWRIDNPMNVGTSGITSAAPLGTLSYQWYRVDTAGAATLIPSATGSSYTPSTKDDVGKKIKVVVTAENYSGSLEATSPYTVSKKPYDGPTPTAPTGITPTSNFVSFTKTENYYYAVKSAAITTAPSSGWTNQDGFSDLTPNTSYKLWYRIGETDIMESSSADYVEFTTLKSSATITIAAPGTIIYDGSAVEVGSGKDLNYTYGGDGAVTVKWYANNGGSVGSALSGAPTNAGTYWIGVSAAEGTNSAAVSEVTKKFTISPRNISEVTVASIADKEYTGGSIEPPLTVTYNGAPLTSGTDYTVEYTSNLNVGTATATIKAKAGSNFTGEKAVTFEIKAKAITPVVTVTGSYEYTGNSITPTYKVEITSGGMELPTNQYNAEVSNNTNAGNGNIKITAKANGNYSFSEVNKTFTIAAKDVSSLPATISDQTTIKGVGEFVDPVIKGVKGEDLMGTLTYAYDGETSKSHADVVAMLKTKAANDVVNLTYTFTPPTGNYTGTNTGSFKVTVKDIEFLVGTSPASVANTLTVKADPTYGDDWSDIVKKQTGVTITAKVGAATDADQSHFTLRPTGKPNAGNNQTYELVYNGTINGTNYANVVVVSGTVDVARKDVTAAMIASIPAQTYTGSAIQPKPVVTDGVALAEGTDFTYSYGANTDVATGGKVTITGQGNYKGTADKTFTISPKNINGATINLTSASLPYNGSEQTVSITSVTLTGWTITAGDYDIVGNSDKATNVGSTTLTIQGKGNYTGTAATTWKITAIDPVLANFDVTPALSTAQTYDGAHKTVTVVPKSGVNGMGTVKVYYEATAGITYPKSETAPTDVGTYKVTASVAAGSNYNAKDIDVGTLTINQATGGTLAAYNFQQKYTDLTAKTITPDYSDLPAGQTWTYSTPAPVTTGTAAVTGTSIGADTGVLSYTLTAGAKDDTVKWTVTISSHNYAAFTKEVTLTLTDKDDQAALTLTGGTTVVYGQTLQLGTSGGNGTGAVTYAVTNGTGEATIDAATGKLTPVKVGTVKVKATKAGDASYNSVTSAEVEITITRATPTGAPKYTAITTSGKTLADAGLTTTGSTLNPNAGTLVWVDNAGTVLPDTTAVAANTTYKWLFTPTDTNYTTLTGSIELYHKSSSGGGGWYYTYYTIKATAGTNGSISPSGWTSVRDGRDQTFTITPDKGYAVAKVLVDGKSVGAVKSYTFKNVTKDHTIEAIFMKSNGNPQTGVFVDVAEGSYYEEAIDWAVEKGITNGVSSNMFAPNDPCTRAQIVTFLWRAAGSPAPKSMSSFTDVPADAFYAKAVAWAVENGITSGTGESKFSPNSTCTRAQAVTFLYRASGSPAVSGSAEFSDVATNAYYADAVAWAAKKGITTGIGGGLFGSDNDCTRGQIVTFLWRAMAE